MFSIFKLFNIFVLFIFFFNNEVETLLVSCLILFSFPTEFLFFLLLNKSSNNLALYEAVLFLMCCILSNFFSINLFALSKILKLDKLLVRHELLIILLFNLLCFSFSEYDTKFILLYLLDLFY